MEDVGQHEPRHGSPSHRTSASNAVDRADMMWGSDADEGEFAAIWPLWCAEDHAARDTVGCAAVPWRGVAWRWGLCGSA